MYKYELRTQKSIFRIIFDTKFSRMITYHFLVGLLHIISCFVYEIVLLYQHKA